MYVMHHRDHRAGAARLASRRHAAEAVGANGSPTLRKLVWAPLLLFVFVIGGL